MANLATTDGRTTIKVRMEVDYWSFVAGDGVADAVTALASALAIDRNEISVLDVRHGCVVLVISLPDEAANRLLSAKKGPTESLSAALESLKISKIIEGDQIEATELVRALEFSADVSWLHLSDLHITSDYADPVSDTYADLSRFLEDLPKRLREAQIVPDALFFTGDVAQAGTTAEYEAAEEFFADLQQALPDEARLIPIMIVPGNHDTDWSQIESDAEKTLRATLKSTSNADAVIAANKEYIDRRQDGFRQFIQNLQTAKKLQGKAVPPLDGLHFVKSFSARALGVHVAVSGFNSSWLSTRKDLYGSDAIVADLDLQHLRLGKEQLRRASASIDMKEATIRIALMHHEPLSEWYAEVDRETQRQELSRYDFVLRGHQHESCARIGAKVAGTDDFVELAPGALRTKPHWYQGFMTSELDLGRGLMRQRAWCVAGHSRRWLPDPEFGRGGSEVRALPERLMNYRNGRH